VEAMAEELAGRRVQVLHALDSPAADLTRRLAGELDARYIVSSYALGDGKRLGTLDGRCAGVLAASEPIRRDLLEHHVAAAEKIRLVHPGVHQVRHTTLFDNPQQSTAIVTGGRLDDAQAFESVLKCFAEIKGRGNDCVFFIIGGGPAEMALRRQADKLGLREALTFVDRQPPTQLAGIFKAADIYVSPVPLRRLDMNSLLAMAAGDPVIAAVGGCSDFLIDGKTALLFKSGDSAELTMKLSSLLDDHPAARALAENSLCFLRENYSPAIMVHSLAGLYRQVAQEATVVVGAPALT
jgi:glycosyltransferase involved in cell wall biosynthesis